MIVFEEQFIYQVYFLTEVIEGLKDAEENRIITTEVLLKRVDQWESGQTKK